MGVQIGSYCSYVQHFINKTIPFRATSFKEIKPRIVNQHSVFFCFECDLCDLNYVRYTAHHLFQRIADHRYSAIGCP